MDEKTSRQLIDAGIDVQEILSRFMGNEALMMKFLLRFPQDESFQQLKGAMAANNVDEAYRAAHALKGLTGNLAMKSLFEQVCRVVEDLRGGNLNSAEGKMKGLEASYCCVVDALRSMS